MFRRRSRACGSGAAAILVLLVDPAHLSRAASGGREFDFFEARVRPVLVERCYKCHSAGSDRLKGGLRLDSRESLLKGGKSGKPAVVPGDAGRSLLIEAIRYANDKLQMPPPDRGGPLNPEQIADFVAWVNAGAPDPRGEKSDAPVPKPTRVKTHWAFVAPRRLAPPEVKLKSWPLTPIDNFILARLEANGWSPSPSADRRTLIRRATYDLIGLPPTLAEVDAFVKDKSRDAFAKVVDRLLASPQYGERWGRYWLDLARYSDTKGYVYDREEKRFVHSHVYRDWVIHSLNEDLPYDRFLVAQIAGDQMGRTSGESGARADLAALGFLTLGRRFLGVQHDIIDDRIDVLTRGTMGLTVACARCHDHKYDPIPTQDYYSLYGVFSSCSEATVPLEEGSASTPESESYHRGLREREEKLQRAFEKKRDELNARLRRKAADYLAAVLEVANLPTEEFYTLAGPEDLNPVIVRQWESFIFKSRGENSPNESSRIEALNREAPPLSSLSPAPSGGEGGRRPGEGEVHGEADSVFRPWHELASLTDQDFAGASAAVLAGLSAISNGPARVNRQVLEALQRAPLRSMRDVAQRYGQVLAEVEKLSRAAVTGDRTNQTGPSPALTREQEEIRLVLYGADSPASVPRGAMVDIEWFFDEGTRVELAKLQAEIERWMIGSPGAPAYAVILEDRPHPKNARVFLRGNPANKGEEVPRQFLSVVAGPKRAPFQRGSGRLELAQAIANRDNPLTARVLVNRLWMHHFGAGLVRTPSDFGTRAEPPTHPELLDWLSVWFVENGWSLKKLHRLIMRSSVYQQTSDAEPEIGRGGTFRAAGQSRASVPPAQADPENRLLWRMNKQRLDFEAMRDSLLAVTGELDRTRGGKAVELFGKTPSVRRTVYGYIDRQFVPGVWRVFDFANPDLHIPQRSDTTVPQQALFFMNNTFVIERSRALIRRTDVQERRDPTDRIRELYRLLYQREPTRRQLRWGLEFVRSALREPRPGTAPVVTAWRYGYGEYDEGTQRVTAFELLPHFTGEAWQGGPNWPDSKLGWVQLTSDGGHAGNDRKHAAIRRWVAPRDGILSVSGTVAHELKPGDGITARIVSSRAGLLASWSVHDGKADAKIERIDVKKNDTVDFVVDFRANLNSDTFRWAPLLRLVQPNPGTEPLEWSAKREFAGPAPTPPLPLSAWEKYAQVLLEANEFLFVD